MAYVRSESVIEAGAGQPFPLSFFSCVRELQLQSPRESDTKSRGWREGMLSRTTACIQSVESRNHRSILVKVDDDPTDNATRDGQWAPWRRRVPLEREVGEQCSLSRIKELNR